MSGIVITNNNQNQQVQASPQVQTSPQIQTPTQIQYKNDILVLTRQLSDVENKNIAKIYKTIIVFDNIHTDKNLSDFGQFDLLIINDLKSNYDFLQKIKNQAKSNSFLMTKSSSFFSNCKKIAEQIGATVIKDFKNVSTYDEIMNLKNGVLLSKFESGFIYILKKVFGISSK
jgi:hypothetical protein